ATGLELVGAWRTALGLDDECILLWAIPDWATWAGYERAWQPGGDLEPWRRTVLAAATALHRTLLVDAPLSPLRIGRQPEAGDRVPLDEVR
ncbi:MAG: NIPSNAP family containing protein, partial [Actinomycetota bacterium]|nr:NIPSNAP family containing protein [Actinomycetota bacterium]